MTREEIVKRLNLILVTDTNTLKGFEMPHEPLENEIEALKEAIELIEREPSDDAISRQTVLDIVNFEDKWLFDAKSHNKDTKIAFSAMKSQITKMPPVRGSYEAGYNDAKQESEGDK